MSRREDRSIADRLAEVERAVEMLEVVHVWTEIVVVARVEPWLAEMRTVEDVQRCAVFEPVVEVVSRWRDLDLLFDPNTGERVIRSAENAEAFDALAAKVDKSFRIELRCHQWQVDPVLSRAKITAVLGGNRAGKTRVLLLWMIRQWILRGRAPTPEQAGAVFWWVGPTLAKSFKYGWNRGLRLLLPRELVVSAPKSHRSTSLAITLLDGSAIELQHAFEDGGNLKSENVSGIAGDELGEWHDQGNWQQVNSRVLQAGAQAAISTTPVAGHWGRTAIILQEPHSGGAIKVFALDLFQNPYLSTARILAGFLGDSTLTETELAEQVLPAPDHAAACRAIVTNPRSLREHFGVWTAEGIKLWAEWTEEVERACTRAGGGVVATDLRVGKRLVAGRERGPELLRDCTAQACGSIFGPAERCPGCRGAGCSSCSGSGTRTIRRVAGEDFNRNPQTTLPCQVFGDPEAPETWVIYVIEEIQTVGTIEEHADRLATIDRDLAIVCDPSGDIPRRAQGALDSDDASRLRARGYRVVSAVGRGRSLRSQSPTLALLHKLIRERRVIVHMRCVQTLRALQTQKAKPDGRIDKRAGTNSPSDQLSSPTDALRYLTWRLFKHELEHAAEYET